MGDTSDPDSIVLAAVYVLTGDQVSTGPRQCYVGYNREGNVVATTPNENARWVHTAVQRHGGWCQRHPASPLLIDTLVRQGERLAAVVR